MCKLKELQFLTNINKYLFKKDIEVKKKFSIFFNTWSLYVKITWEIRKCGTLMISSKYFQYLETVFKVNKWVFYVRIKDNTYCISMGNSDQPETAVENQNQHGVTGVVQTISLFYE